MIKLASDGPVVMVDDNAGDLFFVQRCFGASKLTNSWLAFSRGRDLLDMLERAKQGQDPMPALVLLDLNMPGMSGLELLQLVRADQSFDVVPIFCILTSSSDPRDREKARQLGVSGFCTKTSNMNEYIAFFDSLL